MKRREFRMAGLASGGRLRLEPCLSRTVNSIGISKDVELIFRCEGALRGDLGDTASAVSAAALETARRLGVEPSLEVVVESATAGVEAGCAGHSSCVIGVDCSGSFQALTS